LHESVLALPALSAAAATGEVELIDMDRLCHGD
jgi:hypothetical protein